MRFGGGKLIESIGIVDIKMPIGIALFYVLDTPTLFLLSLRDIDRLNVYLNNLKNILVHVSDSRKVPVIRQ